LTLCYSVAIMKPEDPRRRQETSALYPIIIN